MLQTYKIVKKQNTNKKCFLEKKNLPHIACQGGKKKKKQCNNIRLQGVASLLTKMTKHHRLIRHVQQGQGGRAQGNK